MRLLRFTRHDRRSPGLLTERLCLQRRQGFREEETFGQRGGRGHGTRAQHRQDSPPHASELPDRFKQGDGRGIGQIQAAGLGADRDPQHVVRLLIQPVLRQSATFGPEYQGVSRP